MKKTILVIAAMIFLIGAASANAGSINVIYDKNEVNDIVGLTQFDTFGDDMDGMEVTVGWETGDITYIWGDLGTGSGGVDLGKAGTLSLDGDSFYDSWILDTTSGNINYVIINALSGNAVFDVGNPEKDSNGDPIFGTPGSKWGIAFGYQLDNYDQKVASSVDIGVTYSLQVGVGGADPVGDLYGQLKIDFDDPFTSTDRLIFVADTDTIAPVPEPSTMLLLGLGLAGLIGYNRKRIGNKG